MQEWGQFCNIVEQYKPEILYYEQPPLKDGKITLLKLGAVQGLILALCAQYNIQVKFLSPADWRREVGLYDGTREGTKRDELKKKSIEKANQLFGLDLAWIAPKSSKNEDDVADAIMIAYSQVKPRYFGKSKE
nr:MAG TPA: RuvC [Caudoviricetes sp.]